MREEKRRRGEEKGMNANGLLQEELKGKQVIQVACGAHHTAALTARGRLWLWGDNSKDQAFVVEASEISPVPKLVEVSPPPLPFSSPLLVLFSAAIRSHNDSSSIP